MSGYLFSMWTKGEKAIQRNEFFPIMSVIISFVIYYIIVYSSAEEEQTFKSRACDNQNCNKIP